MIIEIKINNQEELEKVIDFAKLNKFHGDFITIGTYMPNGVLLKDLKFNQEFHSVVLIKEETNNIEAQHRLKTFPQCYSPEGISFSIITNDYYYGKDCSDIIIRYEEFLKFPGECDFETLKEMITPDMRFDRVKIREIIEAEVELYDPSGILVGNITSELQFTDVRVQIHEQNLEGYYIVYGDDEYPIDSNGRLRDWPKGLYEELANLSSKLL